MSSSISQGAQRLVIAIDYGTTFTGVAFATPFGEIFNLREIQAIQTWGDGQENTEKVPSAIAYRGARFQWGVNIDADAIALVHTKLELEGMDLRSELEKTLDSLTKMKDLNFLGVQVSDGIPSYPWKSPEQIVTDYLTEVFKYVKSVPQGWGGNVLLSQLAVDIVITVPVGWSYKAKNATYQAVTKAGFNRKNFRSLDSVIMLTEPEAAALYTTRSLLLREAGNEDFLREGECFVLADAGGGTVDVVAYQVKTLEPLELKRIGLPTGSKCGSIFIDIEFKKWLRWLLGADYYNQLDPDSAGADINTYTPEGKNMRYLMKQFQRHKHFFGTGTRDIRMDLPAPLDKLTLGDKVVDGEITVSFAEMESFFLPSIRTIVELIRARIGQILTAQYIPRSVFLVGGFGESKFLRRELDMALAYNNIQIHQSGDSWASIVKGGVICGIEKSRMQNVTFITTMPSSYGITVHEHYSEIVHGQDDRYLDPLAKTEIARWKIGWLFRKGEVLFSDSPRVAQQPLRYNLPGDALRKVAVPIYEYKHENPPESFEQSKNELQQVATLEFDPRAINIKHTERKRNSLFSRSYISFLVTVELRLEGEKLQAKLLAGNQTLAAVDIPFNSSSGTPKARVVPNSSASSSSTAASRTQTDLQFDNYGDERVFPYPRQRRTPSQRY